eukprot:TRINITY_DN18848_c0_g1_i1.p1 TRINITY_DN18848_c0_g1~~TRINITY_DN18848_c0_g1_i1.p1  ORF type:complete len:182 (+),score=38.56 TRINITY_DN18848_c0_g1_i1:42-548(+)
MIPSSASSFLSVPWLLSLSIAGTFIGHGSIALNGGEGKWYTYLQVAGIGSEKGGYIMRLIGIIDILVGVLVIIQHPHPHPAVLVWAAVWGLATALMRPLSGESIWAALERAGNFIPAVALLCIVIQDTDAQQYWLRMMVYLFVVGVIASLFLRKTKILSNTNKSTVKK